MQKAKVELKSILHAFCVNNKLLCIKILLFQQTKIHQFHLNKRTDWSFSRGKPQKRSGISYDAEKSVAPKQIQSPRYLPLPQSHSKHQVSSPVGTTSFQTSIKSRQYLHLNLSTIKTGQTTAAYHYTYY